MYAGIESGTLGVAGMYDKFTSSGRASCVSCVKEASVAGQGIMGQGLYPIYKRHLCEGVGSLRHRLLGLLHALLHCLAPWAQVVAVLNGCGQGHRCPKPYLPNPDPIPALHLLCLRLSGSFSSWLSSVASSWASPWGSWRFSLCPEFGHWGMRVLTPTSSDKHGTS